jgi:hypothetical protein
VIVGATAVVVVAVCRAPVRHRSSRGRNGHRAFPVAPARAREDRPRQQPRGGESRSPSKSTRRRARRQRWVPMARVWATH